MTDRRTDGQTDARGKTICLPTLSGGDIITNVSEITRSYHCLQLAASECLKKKKIISIVAVLAPSSLIPFSSSRQ